MALLQATVLILVALSGTAIVTIREPLRQAIAMGYYGLLLGVMFFLLQAPDVAMSQIAVGAVALPFMILLALARLKYQREQRERGKETQS
jgi:uncharacterized MnhB-related membrane protein